MADSVSVKFLRSFDLYNEGDKAGFSPKRAEALIKAKVAVALPKRKTKKCPTPSAAKTEKS